MIRFFVDHPVATWMIFVAFILTGLYALPRLDIQAMPETELPSLSIVTRWTGASPSAIQRSITVPIEEAARKIRGVEEITARSAPGYSRVQVSLRRDVDVEFARLELSEQLGAVRRNLPAQASQPQIVPYVPEDFRTENFFAFSLVSPLPTNELRDRADTWLVPRLLAIPGVADAELQGGALPLIHIRLDLSQMERYSLTADQVYARLDALDDILPAGAIRRAGLQLTVGLKDQVDLEKLRRAVLTISGGQPITLDHIGRIELSHEDPTYFVRINGQNVVEVSVAKRSGKNAVTVSRAIRRALPRIEAQLPFPVTFEIDEDQGEELEEKLIELAYRSLIILALLFALLAIALRRVRLTGIVIASILFAIVICLTLFYFFGISVNFITISGLTVCFGMLLDNSILVLDAIHRRLSSARANSGGESVTPATRWRLIWDLTREALVSGTREVAFPIMTTTLTTVVAFLSFSFLSGRLALYYLPLAASVGIAMMASVFVAFCWVPVALRGPAAREQAHAVTQEAPPALRPHRLLLRWAVVTLGLAVAAGAVFALVKGFHGALDHWIWGLGIVGLVLSIGVLVAYIDRITAFNLRFWPIPVIVLAGLIGASYHIYKNEIHVGGFWRQEDEQTLSIYIERPVGTDVVLSSETMKLFEAEMLPLPDGIDMKSWSVENRAYMQLKFEDEMLYTAYPELLRNKLILLAEQMAGMFIYIGGFGDPYLKGGRGGMMSNSLIRITGYNSKTLNALCEGVVAQLGRNRRVRNVRLSSGDRFERAAADETVVILHRDRLNSHHLSVGEVMGNLRRLLGIETPWHMLIDGEDERLQLGYLDADEIQYDQIMNKTFTTSRGGKVRLGDLITLETRPVIGSINRQNQRYAMQINWEYIGTDRMRQAFIGEIIDGLKLPYGYTAEDVSGARMSEEEEEEMKAVLWLTVLFIFMTLAALFESITLPFLVLMSVPMALVGVMGLYWATDASFDSSARIGLVLLFGIVVNNAILLINRFRLQIRECVGEGSYGGRLPEKARLGGVDLWRLPAGERREMLRQAICTGMSIQLRSILLTSGTTVAGLLPLLIKISDQSAGRDIWENLALSSIGGLASSTVLIICAIPALYWVMTRLGWALLRAWHWARGTLYPTRVVVGAGAARLGSASGSGV